MTIFSSIIDILLELSGFRDGPEFTGAMALQAAVFRGVYHIRDHCRHVYCTGTE